MTHASTRGGLTRRRVLAGAAWTTPIIVSSAVVPAYAASYDDTRPDYGIFTQAFVTHQELDTNSFLGLDSFSGPVENEQANVPAGSSGLYSAGGGKFTPAAASARQSGAVQVSGSQRPRQPLKTVSRHTTRAPLPYSPVRACAWSTVSFSPTGPRSTGQNLRAGIKILTILRFPSSSIPRQKTAITLSSSPSTVVLCTVTSAR